MSRARLFAWGFIGGMVGGILGLFALGRLP